MNKISVFVLSCLLVFILVIPSAGPVRSQSTPAFDALAELQKSAGGGVTLQYHTGTGQVSFMGTEPGKPVQMAASAVTRSAEGLSAAAAETALAEETAAEFLATYGSLFGLSNPQAELSVVRVKQAENNLVYVRYQQSYQGIPVVGGELVVAAGKERTVHSAGGEVAPALQLDIQPRVQPEEAVRTALALTAKKHAIAADALSASQPELWIYNPALLDSFAENKSLLVWKVEVSAVELLPIHELVFVDAQLGVAALNFNQTAFAKNRIVYDNNNNPTLGLPGTSPVMVEGSAYTSIPDVNKAYDYSGDTYDFYYNYHQRDSIDSAGMALISTVRYCPTIADCPYANAYWDISRKQMVYGAGFASADDVIAHELTHGVTDYESNLYYYMQSGAINEAFSDIWGEFVDLTNGRGTDTADVRWKIGEDLSIGAIRNMKNPTLHNDPDRMTSPLYLCSPNTYDASHIDQDYGYVHSNSGVANKAAYLMTDGDTFNGYTITGIGITKAAKIWYHVQANMFTSAGDYNDLHNNLYQACTSLIGSGGITSLDCTQVRSATLATEMNLQPACAAVDAPLCPAGGSPSTLFFDNLENTTSGNWTSGPVSGYTNEFYYPQLSNPYGYDASYSTSGIYNFWGYNVGSVADFTMRMNKNITLPSTAIPYLHFKHSYNFEGVGYDGGVIEYSTNNGLSWADAVSAASSTINSYKGAISGGYSNPLAGRQAFIGHSNGYISSRLTLTSLAGKSVRFRFRIGTDDGGDDFGWFIDDINVYTCPGASALRKVFLPMAVKPMQPPAAGLWESTTAEEFYITPDQQYVNKFSIYISVNPCGNYKITHDAWVPVTDRAFSFSGAFYSSGVFSNSTTATGTDGLSSFYIPNCGYVTGGPWNYTAFWTNSTQPAILHSAERVSVAELEDSPEKETPGYRVIKLED